MTTETLLESILKTVAEKEKIKRKHIHLEYNNGFQVVDYNNDWIVKFDSIEEFEIKYKVVLV